MTSKATAAIPLDPKIKAGIKSVKAFYGLGIDSLKKVPDRLGHQAKDEAERRGVTPDYLNKARAFADPESGYTEQDLTAIYKLSKRHKYVIGVNLMVRLTSIADRRERSKFQQQALEEGWSINRLEQEIYARHGRRRQGGRRRTIPADLRAVLTQLDELCDGWRRWVEALEREPETGKTKLLLKDLTKPIRVKLIVVTSLVKGLRGKVREELAKEPAEAGSRPQRS